MKDLGVRVSGGFLGLSAALTAAILLSGCAQQPRGIEATVATPPLKQGRVTGGQQPVNGATLQLYAVGAGGDGSAATPLLTPAAVTDANGNFTISGTYTCPGGNPLVYLVATGGNPGAAATNGNLALMAALGPCNSLSASTYITINELTTVGAVYPLAAFMTSAGAIGSGTGDAAALSNAFTLASELVNPATGTTPGVSVPLGTTIPVAQIDTIADILANCVNSTGGVAGDGSGCGNLFSLTTGSSGAPTNTIAALLYLANNPGMNTAALYELVPAIAPFQPAQTGTPVDLSIPLTYPSLIFSPIELSFGNWATGFTSTPQTITIANTSVYSMTLSATISGGSASDFGIDSSLVTACGATLAPQSNCTYQLHFSPSGAGSFNAFLVVSTNSTNPLIEIPLSGTGVGFDSGPVTFSQSSLSFTVAGTTQDVTLENFGSTPLTISDIEIANFGSNSNIYQGGVNFSQTSNCGASLAAQSVCTISVGSTGIAWGQGEQPVTYTATLTVYDNSPSGSQTLSLSSTNRAMLAPITLDFGYGQLGIPHSQSLTFSSGSYYVSANLSVTIGGPGAADYSVNPNYCVFGVEGSSDCAPVVTFNPSVTGARSAKLLVNSTNQYVPLTGIGVGAGPFFTITASSLSLENALPIAPDPNGGGPTAIVIKNFGTTTFSFSGNFTGPNASLMSVNGSNCLSVAPQAACSATVSFQSNAVGTYSATLVVKDANSTVTQSIPINASTYYWNVVAFPGNLSFGTQAVGTSSAAQSFVLADPNHYPLGHVLSISLPTLSNFTLTQGASCPASLVTNCTLAVAFTPHGAGSFSESGTITDQTTGETGLLWLYGTGGAAVLSLSSSSITFPARAVDTTSVPTTVTLTNIGTVPLTVASVSVAGAISSNFTETNSCTSVAVNGSCSIDVTFSPTSSGVQSATLQINSNDLTSLDAVQLTGTAY